MEKRRLIGPRDFVILSLRINAYQSVLCFEDTIKLASISGIERRVNIPFRHFLLPIRDFFICSPWSK